MSGAGLRAIAPLAFTDIEPGGAGMPRPSFREVAPTSLFVDEAYQRNLSDRSIRLIRKIITDWDWRRFKPPVVVETDVGLEVIDGQHTAIGAASHPLVGLIPIMVVDAPEVSQRAAAFIGHNRDRIAVTATQMHFAALAAFDETALVVDEVCARVGIRILRNPPGRPFAARETMAVAAIAGVISRMGVPKARQLLDVLASAEMKPIKAVEIRALEMLMTDPEYSGEFDLRTLASTIISLGPSAEREAKVFMVSHRVPLWRALAIVWFKKCPKRRASRSAPAPSRETPAPPPSRNLIRSTVNREAAPFGPRVPRAGEDVTARLFGDPGPGRSALDEKRRGGGS